MRKNFSTIKPLNYDLFFLNLTFLNEILSCRFRGNSQFGGYISVHYNSIRPLDEQTHFFSLDFVSFSTGCFLEKTSKRGKTPKPFNFYVEFADAATPWTTRWRQGSSVESFRNSCLLFLSFRASWLHVFPSTYECAATSSSENSRLAVHNGIKSLFSEISGTNIPQKSYHTARTVKYRLTAFIIASKTVTICARHIRMSMRLFVVRIKGHQGYL